MSRATFLPLTLAHGHIYAPVMLDGAPMNMLVDTGAYRTIVTQDAANRMALRTGEASGFLEGIGGSRSQRELTAKTFQIGRLSGRHLPLVVGEMSLPPTDRPADGLLGADFLASYDLDVDLIGRRLIFYTASPGCAAKPAAVLTGDLYTAKMQAENDRELRGLIPVTINGHTLRALVDTGADHTTIFRDAASRVGLDITTLSHSDLHIHGAGIGPHARDAIRHVMTPMAIGDVTISNLPAAIIDQASGNDGVQMLIGMDFMRRVHLWLSFSSRTLVMEYPPVVSPPTAP